MATGALLLAFLLLSTGLPVESSGKDGLPLLLTGLPMRLGAAFWLTGLPVSLGVGKPDPDHADIDVGVLTRRSENFKYP